jgi:hypothetical protein
MTRLVVLACLLGAVTIPVVSAAAKPAQSPRVAQCGSFKFGTDGSQPGPSGITAKNVSCWFARATALLGAAPGWRCQETVGITFVCKPGRGSGVVTFFGE